MWSRPGLPPIVFDKWSREAAAILQLHTPCIRKSSDLFILPIRIECLIYMLREMVHFCPLLSSPFDLFHVIFLIII